MMVNNNWKEFKISEIFTFEKGKCSNAPELNDGFDIPYIAAKKRENGIGKWVALDSESENLITKGNCIIFICQGAGSNGYNLYVDVDSILTTSNSAGYNENLNKFNGLFLVTVLDLERPKWSFGRGRSKKLKDTIIKLPSIERNGAIEPDWDFMTKYMKEIFDKIKNDTEKEFSF